MNRKQRRATQKKRPVAGLRPAASANDSIAALYERAEKHFARGELDDAADYLKKVLALNPNYAAAHDGLGQVLFAQGKLAAASQEFAQAAIIAPQVLRSIPQSS